MPLPETDPGVALAGELLAAQLVPLRAALGAVAPPPPVLEGWASLCALEYSQAVLHLDAALLTARAALGDVIALLQR